MNVSKVCDGIFRLSANARDILFEGIWPIPNGVSMNSYIVKGEKVAIVDGVCGWDGVPETLFEQLAKMEIELNEIDYVVINHMEPDHSGWLEEFRKLRGDDFTIVTSEKAVPLLKAFYDISVPTRVVKEGDTLDLGAGRVLSFVEIPNVHWPETIATFDTLSGTLMPCDAFGSYGAITEAPYDDDLSEADIDFFEKEAVRYYANIVAAFSLPAKKAVDKVEALGDALKIIAPGHGIVWRKNPKKIINDYKRYAAYQKGPCKAEVTVIWGSMYGNTEKAVEPVVQALKEEGVAVNVHRVPDVHVGEILASVWNSTGIVLGMPTYEYKMFPPMYAALDELAKKKAMNRVALRFGSFGWSGGAQTELDELMTRYKTGWQFLEPQEFKGSPTEEDLRMLKEKARDLARKVKELAAK